MTIRSLVAVAVGTALAAIPVAAQAPDVLDDSIVPASGANFAVAQFRFWSPPAPGPLRAVLVLVPGSNGDGRSMAQDTVWQAFATKHKLGIIACRFTDKPHDQSFFEDYIAVSKGSGDALLTALSHFAERSGHAEVASAPFLMWGMSAGGQFNWEFVAWKPDRVVGFVVNKGGVYYSALLSKAARQVPGILFTGGKDLEFRTTTINGLFAVNRRGGALWALADEPNAGHIVGKSRDLAMILFEDLLAVRLPASGNALVALEERTGFLGDLKAKTYAPLGDGKVPNLPTAWLPTERVAKAWLAMVTDQPIIR
jgi:poly(3-hydroxybutyrate) depolymerase